MPITREMLEQRLAESERERAQVLANLNAFNGAIQDVRYWLEVLAADEKSAVADA